MECSKAGQLHPVRSLGQVYCSTKCQSAGISLACRHCHEPVNAEWPHCVACKWGLPPPPSRKRPSSSELQEMTEKQRWLAKWEDRNDESERVNARLMRQLHCEPPRGPDHEPAWKRRRRS